MSSRRSLLIIEDDPDLRVTLEYFLGKVGYEVIAASNSKDGLRLCVERHPRAILCDIMLPDMDGFEVCTKLKGDPATREMVVIFITAKQASEVLSRGSKACADFWIPKPVDPNDVAVDLYFLFEQDFDLSEEDLKKLRVTRPIPQIVHSAHVQLTKKENHLPEPPAASHHQTAPPAPVVTESVPPTVQPQPSPHLHQEKQKTVHVSHSTSDLDQVHQLLLALKDSLKDTSLRVDAILQYIQMLHK